MGTATLLIIITAAVCRFLHYCIGSPIQGEYYTGRIFSDYGKWISKKYLAFEEKEHSRVWADYLQWKKLADKKLSEDLENKTEEQAKLVYYEYLQRVDAVFNDVENNKKLNMYSGLGACPICFSTWVSLIMFIFFIIFVPLPWWWIFVGAPSAVVLSRYINLT
jgi:hypothetical protein